MNTFKINGAVQELIHYSKSKNILFYDSEYNSKQRYKIFDSTKNISWNFEYNILRNIDYGRCYKIYRYYTFFDDPNNLNNSFFSLNLNNFTLNEISFEYKNILLKNIEEILFFVVKDKVFTEISIPLKDDNTGYLDSYVITQVYDLVENKLLKTIDINLELKSSTNNYLLAVHPNQDIVVYSNRIYFLHNIEYNKGKLDELKTFAYSIKQKKIVSIFEYPIDYSIKETEFTPDGKLIFFNTGDTEDNKNLKVILARVYDLEKNVFLYDLGYNFFQYIETPYQIEKMFFSSNSKYGIFFISPEIIFVFEALSGKGIARKEKVFEMVYDSESDIILYTMDDYKKNEKTFIIESLEEFIEKNRNIKKSFVINFDE